MEVEGKSIIEILPEILRHGKIKSEEIIHSDTRILNYQELIINSDNNKTENLLYHGDNLDCISSLIYDEYIERIDLIYIDPPFLTMANYKCKTEVLDGDELNTIESVAV